MKKILLILLLFIFGNAFSEDSQASQEAQLPSNNDVVCILHSKEYKALYIEAYKGLSKDNDMIMTVAPMNTIPNSKEYVDNPSKIDKVKDNGHFSTKDKINLEREAENLGLSFDESTKEMLETLNKINHIQTDGNLETIDVRYRLLFEEYCYYEKKDVVSYELRMEKMF